MTRPGYSGNPIWRRTVTRRSRTSACTGRSIAVTLLSDRSACIRRAASSSASASATQATEQLKLSARGYYPVLKVARTHADLHAADDTARLYVAEALSYQRILLRR